MKKINRDEIEKRIEAAFRPMFETSDKWMLMDKVFALVCDKDGQFTIVERHQVEEKAKIINITERLLHERPTAKEWDKIIVKAAIYLDKAGLYDRGEHINEKAQMQF